MTAQYLENAALHYLQRFASSSANLRRVLMAKVERSARAHGTDRTEGAELVDRLIARYRQSGLLDDQVYADAKAASLRRRGASARGVRQKLAMKGVDTDIAETALAGVDSDAPGEPEIAAAVAYARRRRLGAFRAPGRTAADRAGQRDKDMAALGRAGFAYEVARQVIDADDPESLVEPESPLGPGG